MKLRFFPIALTLSVAIFSPPTVAGHCPDLLTEAIEVAAMRDSDPAGGITRGRAAIDTLISGHICHVEEARLHAAIATNLNVLGRNEEAIQEFAIAVAKGDGYFSDRDRALVFRGLGLAYYDSGDYNSAISNYVISLQASDAAEDSIESAKTAANIGILYTTLGQFERAREFHERALQSFTDADFTMGIAGTLINLGSLAARSAESATAAGDEQTAQQLNEELRDNNQRAMELFEGLGNRRGIAYAASNVGLGWDRLGDPARGLGYHQRSLDVRRELGDAHGTINSLVTMASSLTSLGRLDEAEARLDEAQAMLPEGNPTLALTVVEPRIVIAETRGNLGEALRLQREVARIRSEIVSAGNQARVTEIETRYEAERLRRQVSDLELQQQLASERLRRQQQRILAAGLIVVLLLALVVTLQARYRLKVRSQLALEQAARTDELTGLSNRRDIRERIEYEVTRSRRNSRPFSIALIDLDEFKTINDNFGHEAGDQVLIEVARRISEQLRRQDTLARWGGDELLALLPETDERGALALANKLVASFATHSITTAGGKYPLTLTIGVAQFWPGMDIDQCLRCADEALYRGKDSGRNAAQAARP